jgi:hypothetical protein
MNVLAAIKREERKLEKQVVNAESPIDWGAGGSKSSRSFRSKREVVGAKKRVLSAAGRAEIIKAAKKRWAKVRKQAKRAVS